jgi:hypothetical protein
MSTSDEGPDSRVDRRGRAEDVRGARSARQARGASTGRRQDAGPSDPAIDLGELGIRLDHDARSPEERAAARRELRADSGYFNLQGIGTTFYGRRDYDADGSYLTTKWFVVLFVPIVPIHSRRVALVDCRTESLGPTFLSFDHRYIFHGKPTRPDLRQVIYTYSYMIFVAAWTYLVFRFLDRIASSLQNEFSPYVITFFLVSIPVLIPFALRRYARRMPAARRRA